MHWEMTHMIPSHQDRQSHQISGEFVARDRQQRGQISSKIVNLPHPEYQSLPEPCTPVLAHISQARLEGYPSLIYFEAVGCFMIRYRMFGMAGAGHLDQSEHVVAHAAFHGIRFAIFVFDSG